MIAIVDAEQGSTVPAEQPEIFVERPELVQVEQEGKDAIAERMACRPDYVGNLDKGSLPLGPGVAHRPLLRRGKTSVRLIRAMPGASVPVHSHHGRELTLVLMGGFHDETGQFGPGDLESATPETKHRPIADPGEVCINLALTDAPLRFFSALPRLVGKLFGI